VLNIESVIGCDLDNVSKETLSILMNYEVIAVNQDGLGVQGKKLNSTNGLEVWAGPISNGKHAVVLFNRTPKASNMTIAWEQLGISSSADCKVRDLWAHTDLGKFKGSYSAQVPSHGVFMVIVQPRH
jgi:alpha-galactosidase